MQRYPTPATLILGVVLAASCSLLAACGNDSTQLETSAAAAPPPPAATAPTTPPPSPVAPISSRHGADTADAGTAPAATTVAGAENEIVAPGAVFTLPEGWQRETPSSSMRLAQATIPGEAGAGQLTVFYFGPGGGGGVDANLERWIGQMELDAGTEPQRDISAVGDFVIHRLEVQGTLKPSTMGTGPTTPQPGSRLLGAVVEGAQGPWFFKATGPAATIDAARDDFIAMVRSVRTP